MARKAPSTVRNTAGASKKDILDLAAKNNVRFLRLQFTDILGVNKNVEIPQLAVREGARWRHHVRRLVDRRVSCESKSRTCSSSPDLGTFQIFPWGDPENRVARLICDINTA